MCLVCVRAGVCGCGCGCTGMCMQVYTYVSVCVSLCMGVRDLVSTYMCLCMSLYICVLVGFGSVIVSAYVLSEVASLRAPYYLIWQTSCATKPLFLRST
jgi:hypothetical protein